VFGSKRYILADKEQRRKLYPKSDEGIFLGYSTNNIAYRVYNSRTNVVMESINMVVNDVGTEKGANVEQDVGTSGPLIEDHEPEKQSDGSKEEIPEETTEETTDQPTGKDVKSSHHDVIIGMRG
jgi:hypothetical protein